MLPLAYLVNLYIWSKELVWHNLAQSFEKMDKILEGTLNSSHPEKIKTILIDRIIQAASVSGDENVARNIFKYCSNVIIHSNCLFNVSVTNQVIAVWARAYSKSATENLLENTEINLGDVCTPEKKKWLELVSKLLPIIRNANSEIDQSSMLEGLIQAFLKERELEIASAIAQILIQNWIEKLSDGTEFSLVSRIIFLLKNLVFNLDTNAGQFCILTEKTEKVLQINLISALLAKVVHNNNQLLQTVLNELFIVLSNDVSSLNIALASLLHIIPSEMSEAAAEVLSKDDRIKDYNIKLVLNKLIEWLSWPGVRHLDIWIVNFIKHLMINGKKGKLIADLIEKKIAKVMPFLFNESPEILNHTDFCADSHSRVPKTITTRIHLIITV